MENSVKEKIENLINESEVMLFMKGTPEMPQCGFSAAVVGVLNHLGVNYKPAMFYKMKKSEKALKNILIGQLYLNFM